jgi:hypothetical protein
MKSITLSILAIFSFITISLAHDDVIQKLEHQLRERYSFQGKIHWTIDQITADQVEFYAVFADQNHTYTINFDQKGTELSIIRDYRAAPEKHHAYEHANELMKNGYEVDFFRHYQFPEKGYYYFSLTKGSNVAVMEVHNDGKLLESDVYKVEHLNFD